MSTNPRQRQLEFAAAILDPSRPVPPGLVGPDGEPSAKRFSVYRNNVVVGLVEALKAAFPATNRIVGNEFFAAMARVHVSREPPNSPIMLHYGAGFADFVGVFEPAAVLPYLRDVARLERAWAESYHAAEAEPLDPAAFTRISPDRLPDSRLVLHPSLRVVRSSYPIVALWQTNIEGAIPIGIDIDGGGEDALIVRPVAQVEVHVLPAGAAAFIDTIAAGTPIVGAMNTALLDDPRFDLGGTLAGLIECRAIIAWNPTEANSDDMPAARA